jgi:cytochrome bd-type quinol oxidase subunit 2
MKNFSKIRLLVFVAILFSAGSVLAATDTEPPLGLPLVSSTATATAISTAGSVTTYLTATPTYSVTVVSAQDAVDDAETGPSLIILSILSLVAGIGFFLIKKYFDLKRYSL